MGFTKIKVCLLFVAALNPALFVTGEPAFLSSLPLTSAASHRGNLTWNSSTFHLTLPGQRRAFGLERKWNICASFTLKSWEPNIRAVWGVKCLQAWGKEIGEVQEEEETDQKDRYPLNCIIQPLLSFRHSQCPSSMLCQKLQGWNSLALIRQRFSSVPIPLGSSPGLCLQEAAEQGAPSSTAARKVQYDAWKQLLLLPELEGGRGDGGGFSLWACLAYKTKAKNWQSCFIVGNADGRTDILAHKGVFCQWLNKGARGGRRVTKIRSRFTDISILSGER